MRLGNIGNLVVNKRNNQYSLTIRSKKLDKLNILPQELLKAKIDFFGIRKAR